MFSIGLEVKVKIVAAIFPDGYLSSWVFILPQDFVPKEAQADNGKFSDEMRPEPFAR